MKKVILYSMGCPKCKMLKVKLEKAGIEFEECSDIEEMKRLNMLSMPQLSVDGKIYNFSEAVAHLDEIKESVGE